MSKASILVGAAAVLLCPLAPAQTPDVDELLAQTARWQYETSRQPMQALAEAVARAQALPAEMRAIEQKFIAFLKSDATPGGKDFICKQLSVMGTEASVPALVEILGDPKMAELGRYALERIPGPAVDRALRASLAKSAGRTRIGIINTMGVRRDGGVVSLLGPLALGTDRDTASAALYALAKIADAEALAVLSDAQSKTTGPVHGDAAKAYLQAANRLADARNTDAAPIFTALYAKADPPLVQAAALRGLARTGGAQSAPVLLKALRGNSPRLQAAAFDGLLAAAPAQLIAEIPKLSDAAKIRALGVLSERGDHSSLPAFTTALKDPGKPVRLAALEGIAMVADASLVPALAGIAAGEDAAEQAAARVALTRIPGSGVDGAIVDGISGAAPKARLELIRAAGERGTTAASPMLIRMARDADPDVRRESLRALKDTGRGADIAAMVDLTVSPVQPGDRVEAAKSLGTVVRRSDPSGVQDVLAAYTPSAAPEARAALLQVLGRSGSPQALTVLRDALRDQDPAAKRAAILALTEWPDAAPVQDLLAASRAAANPAQQVLAVRGAIQLVGIPAPARPPRESVKMLSEAMALARQPEEKRSILALLPRYPVPEALDLARTLTTDSDVSAEAKVAVARLERTVRN